MSDQRQPRTLVELNIANAPVPYPEAKLPLAEAIYTLIYEATHSKDTMAALSIMHAAAGLVAELNERMIPIANWTPPIPPPLGNLVR